MKKTTFLLLGLLFGLQLNAQVLFSESFDDVSGLTGWDIVNVSTTIGSTDWFQGTTTTFPSQAGEPFAYIAANFNATTGTNTINNWLITPVINLSNDDVIKFYTRTSNGNFPDRLEVRISELGAGSTDPVNDSDVGSYTNLQLSINPSLLVDGYPDTWEEQTITVSGLTGATDVRIAFRYWVTDGGPTGANSSYIGIDEVEINAATLSTSEITELDFNYFLNQVEKTLTIESNFSDSKNISLFNILGQSALQTSFTNATKVIDLSALQSGVYIAKLDSGNTSKTFKIVIQ
ncbi:MAG: choice-of-anchor J domain-containing protein [bacterium]